MYINTFFYTSVSRKGVCRYYFRRRLSANVGYCKLVAEKGLQLSDQLSNNAYFEEVARQFQLSGQELTHLFWEKCNPSGIWVVILAMGFVQTYFSGYTID